jgi:hypothetical protein
MSVRTRALRIARWPIVNLATDAPVEIRSFSGKWARDCPIDPCAALTWGYTPSTHDFRPLFVRTLNT